MIRARYPSITWLFVFGIVGYPLVASLSTLLNVDNQPVSIAFRAFFVLYSIALILIALRDNAPILRTKFWFFYLTFWALYIARILYDTGLADIPTAFPPQNYIIFALGVTLIPSLAFARQMDESTSVAAYLRVVAALVFVQLLFIGGIREELESSLEFRRVQTETLNAISYGLLGALSVALGAGGLILRPTQSERLQGNVNRYLILSLYFVAIVIGAVTLYLSGSRGPFISSFICITIIFLRALTTAGSRIGIVTFTLGAVISAFFLMLPFLVDLDIPLFERLFRTFRQEEASDDIRIELWRRGWEQFLSSPIIGSGLEERTLTYYPHNLPLEAFMATGIIGGLVWLTLLALGARRSIQVVWYERSYAWIGILFILLMANSLLSGNFWNAGAVAYTLVALYAIPIHRKYAAADPLSAVGNAG